MQDQQIVAISAEKHKNHKIRKLDGFDFAGNSHFAALTADEFPAASSAYPIVFIKHNEDEVPYPIALLGLEDGQNLFVKEGKWQSTYIPAIVRRYPFLLKTLNTEDEQKLILCVDNGKEILNEEEGAPLFNEDGSPSEALAKMQDFLANFRQKQLATEKLCELLQQYDLFKPKKMDYQVKGEEKSLSGFFMVDEEKLRELTDEQFLKLRHAHALEPIYTHLNSFAQIRNLIARQSA